jgi:integral membrane sensor domain MASE1
LPPLKDVLKQILNEAKIALEEYFQETEVALKQRLKKFLIFSIVSAILMSVGISLIGAASLFFLIGGLRYLQTFLPSWQAWLIIAATAAVAAAALLISLALIIWRKFRSAQNKNVETQKQQPCASTKSN